MRDLSTKLTDAFWRAFMWFWDFLPDNCEVCLGKKGGTRGNENIIDGVVMCDYCHYEHRHK